MSKGKLSVGDVVIGDVGAIDFTRHADEPIPAFTAPVLSRPSVTIRAVTLTADALDLGPAGRDLMRHAHRARPTLQIMDPITGTPMVEWPVYRTTFDGARGATIYCSPRRFYKHRARRMAGK
jgi:hypothetical protein